MKFIRLSNSRARATVNDGDFESLATFEWFLADKAACVYRVKVDGSLEPMSHTILGRPPGGNMWDHRNGNVCDNRRENLRLASEAQNSRNRRKISSARHRFKGVWKKANHWEAYICIDGKRTYLGCFATEQEAAEAYDRAARQHYGEFACVNFPAPGERGCLV
jgi:hypothetical protein